MLERTQEAWRNLNALSPRRLVADLVCLDVPSLAWNAVRGDVLLVVVALLYPKKNEVGGVGISKPASGCGWENRWSSGIVHATLYGAWD